MALNLTVNGVTYSYPQTGDNSWGDSGTGWASAVSTGMLQRAGGNFYLTADIDFGTTNGLRSLFFASRTSGVAANGAFRLAHPETVSFRNTLNSGDLTLGVNNSDQLTFNGTAIGAAFAIADSTKIHLDLTSSTLTASIIAGSLTNADISAAAAIAVNKLAATTASRALISDSSGYLTASNVTNTELSYVSGVTSAIQTQISAKQDASTAVTLTGVQTLTNKTLTSPIFTSATADQITGNAGVLTLNGIVRAGNLQVSGSTLSDSSGGVTITSSNVANGVVVNASSGATVRLQNAGNTIARVDATSLTLPGTSVKFIDSGTNYVSLSAPNVVTSSYTILLPVAPPTAGTALAFNGSSYVWSAAGGWVSANSSALTAGGTITISTTTGQQLYTVQSTSSTGVTLSTTPFGSTAPNDGTELRLIGLSDTNTVSISNNDASRGCLLKGNATLRRGDSLDLQYSSLMDRYIEISRNF